MSRGFYYRCDWCNDKVNVADDVDGDERAGLWSEDLPLGWTERDGDLLCDSCTRNANLPPPIPCVQIIDLDRNRYARFEMSDYPGGLVVELEVGIHWIRPVGYWFVRQGTSWGTRATQQDMRLMGAIQVWVAGNEDRYLALCPDKPTGAAKEVIAINWLPVKILDAPTLLNSSLSDVRGNFPDRISPIDFRDNDE